MPLKQAIILITALLVGFLGVNQFFSHREAQEAMTRDTSISYVNQLNLVVTTNEKLKGELQGLEEQLQELRTTANVQQVLDKDMERYEKLAGKRSVSGPGVSITIDTRLETFWIIDLINELYVSGAEVISINGTRLTARTGFVSQGDEDMTLYVNNEAALQRPYTIEAIGDSALLYDYLTQNDGIIPRLKKALGAVDSAIQVEKRDAISVPEVPVQGT